jgi:hypothetical protein
MAMVRFASRSLADGGREKYSILVIPGVEPNPYHCRPRHARARALLPEESGAGIEGRKVANMHILRMLLGVLVFAPQTNGGRGCRS